MTEFEIISRYFSDLTERRKDVVLGVGDDAAIVRSPANKEQIVALDTLVSGIHFPVDTTPHAIGHKILAVNLSDLAAMGAEPAWFTLGLSLPGQDASWLQEFARGLKTLADKFHVALIGGDTVRAPVLSLTIQVAGYCDPGAALRRSGARAGDLIYVSGVLGDAGLGLRIATGKINPPPAAGDLLLAALNYPQPRIALGRHLCKVATAAIDISDGLLADLGHILEQSHVGARIEIERIPVSPHYRSLIPDSVQDPLALTAGDDFELCFSVPPSSQNEIEAIGDSLGLSLTRIGRIESSPGLRLIAADGREIKQDTRGYDHFQQ